MIAMAMQLSPRGFEVNLLEPKQGLAPAMFRRQWAKPFGGSPRIEGMRCASLGRKPPHRRWTWSRAKKSLRRRFAGGLRMEPGAGRPIRPAESRWQPPQARPCRLRPKAPHLRNYCSRQSPVMDHPKYRPPN